MASRTPGLLKSSILSTVIFVLCVSFISSGCSSGKGSSSWATPPEGHKLASIEKRMTDVDVRNIMGEPDGSRDYMTGKAWIPFYYGADTHRSDWYYNGSGRVIFTRSRWTGGLNVRGVDYDPDQGK